MEKFTVRYVRGFAFAISEKGQNAYVPHALATEHNLQVGQAFWGLPMLNHNEDQRATTPFVIAAIDGGDVEAPNSVADRDEMVFEAVNRLKVANTAMLTAATRLDATTANNSANRLFEAGRIAQAKLYAKPNQARASFVLWGKDLQSLADLA